MLSKNSFEAFDPLIPHSVWLGHMPSTQAGLNRAGRPCVSRGHHVEFHVSAVHGNVGCIWTWLHLYGVPMRLTCFSQKSRALRKTKQWTRSGWKVLFKLTSWMLKIVWEYFLPLWLLAWQRVWAWEGLGGHMSLREMSTRHSIAQCHKLLMFHEKERNVTMWVQKKNI